MSTAILRSGDMRPWLGSFLEEHHSSHVHFQKRVKMTFHCGVDEKEGKLTRIPAFPQMEQMIREIKEHPKKIHIMGVTVVTKAGCYALQKKKEKGEVVHMDHRKHWFLMIVNPVTESAYLYHPLAYHMDSPSNFAFGVVKTKFMNSFKKECEAFGWKLNSATTPKASKKFITALTRWGKAKLGKEPSARLWFPLLALWEIERLIQYPDKKRKDILPLMAEEIKDAVAMDKYLTGLQDRLESYYSKNKLAVGKCKGKLFHAETGRCVNVNSDVGFKLRGLTSSSRCKNDQVYALETKRCRSAVQSAWMDLKDADARSSEKTFLDDAITSKELNQYLSKLYPHAAIFYDKGSVIKWKFDTKTKTGTLDVPSTIRKFWDKSMADTKKTHIVCFVVLETDFYDVSHANAMIYNKYTQELEVFEPNGALLLDAFGIPDMYKAIDAEFSFIPKKLRTPSDYCPKKMSIFQALETEEKMMWETEGYCAVWTTWYVEHRLMNPKLTTKQCVKAAMDHLLDLGSLRQYIWNYDRWMRRQLEKKNKTK